MKHFKSCCILVLLSALILVESYSFPALQPSISSSSSISSLNVSPRPRARMPAWSMAAANKPKRVAIIGGGLAGLALAIALEKLPTGAETVKIFERTGELRPNIGGGLQINGAISVLSRLGLESELSSTGNRATRILSRKADGSPLLEIDIPKLFQSTAASRAALMQGTEARQVREEVVGKEDPFYSGIKIQFGVGERRPDGGLDGKKYDQIALIRTEATRAAENENYEEADRRAELIAALEKSGMPEDLLLMPEQCQRFFDVGVYFHNPLVPWVKGNLVLAGDAAHAMPPFLGQDVFCLAESLAGIGSSHPDLAAALASYQRQRQPPTTRIMLNSWVIGKLETQAGPGAGFRDGVFSVLGKLGVAKQVFLDGALPKV